MARGVHGMMDLTIPGGGWSSAVEVDVSPTLEILVLVLEVSVLGSKKRILRIWYEFAVIKSVRENDILVV